jgi:hypothetical protein
MDRELRCPKSYMLTHPTTTLSPFQNPIMMLCSVWNQRMKIKKMGTLDQKTSAVSQVVFDWNLKVVTEITFSSNSAFTCCSHSIIIREG